MTRKRTRRKVYGLRPITFGMMREGMLNCRLLAASAIDAMARGAGTDEHLGQIRQVADYCVRLAARLQLDGRVQEVHALAELRERSEAGQRVIAKAQLEHSMTGQVVCASADVPALLYLLDANDALDEVCSQISVRLAREVLEEMVAEVRREVAHA